MCNDVTWPKTSDQVGCHKSFVSEIWSLWNWDLRLPIWESFVRAEIKKINEVQPTWPGCYVNWELYLFVIFKLLREPCYIWAFGLVAIWSGPPIYVQLACELEQHCCCYGEMQGRQTRESSKRQTSPNLNLSVSEVAYKHMNPRSNLEVQNVFQIKTSIEFQATFPSCVMS